MGFNNKNKKNFVKDDYLNEFIDLPKTRWEEGYKITNSSFDIDNIWQFGENSITSNVWNSTKHDPFNMNNIDVGNSFYRKSIYPKYTLRIEIKCDPYFPPSTIVLVPESRPRVYSGLERKYNFNALYRENRVNTELAENSSMPSGVFVLLAIISVGAVILAHLFLL